MGKEYKCPFCGAPRKENVIGREWVFDCECYKDLVVLTRDKYERLKADAEGWEEPIHYSEDI